MSIFFSSKCRLFHNATLFGFCITHILNTGVLKFEKKSVAKRLITTNQQYDILQLYTTSQRVWNDPELLKCCKVEDAETGCKAIFNDLIEFK